MDTILCDELLQEIFRRLPSGSAASASLVSRRWRWLLLSSLVSLRLHLPDPIPSSLLLHFLPSLTSLTSLTFHSIAPSQFNPLLLISALPSSAPPHLRSLKLHIGPLSPSSVASLTSPPSPLKYLTSLHLSSLNPLSFRWLLCFPLLKDLSVLDCSPDPSHAPIQTPQFDSDPIQRLQLESISLSGIRSGDFGFGWLWRRCPQLRKLRLRSCEGTGDGDEHLEFSTCLRQLRSLELRTCRPIADKILRQAAEGSPELESLVLYDGGSRDGLRRFVARSAATLRVLDLRLPLDLDDTHLEAMAARPSGIRSLRLQSCCLLTGEGLRWLTRSSEARGSLEELCLVNCDVVEKEMGLLTHVGQSLGRLKRVDLSFNEGLKDRELGLMVAACGGRVVELRLNGCKGLSDGVMRMVVRWCEALEELDVRGCVGVSGEGVGGVVERCGGLRKIWVEDWKVGVGSRGVALRKGIEILI